MPDLRICGKVRIYGRYGIRRPTTFNLGYVTGWETLRGTKSSRDRGTYGMVLGFTQSIYKRVSLKRVVSIVVDRDSLLPFNPTYVLSNVNTP